MLHRLSLYYQVVLTNIISNVDTDGMGFGDNAFGAPDRIGGKWQLRRLAWVAVNGGIDNRQILNQKVTHKSIIMSTPLKLKLEKGQNAITIGGGWNEFDRKGADVDRIVVYPPE